MCYSKLFMLICLCFTNFCVACRDETACRTSRIRGMKTADCYNINLRKFPKCLGTSIEVMELSMNRIRKLTKEDLEKYYNLKILYLQDNTIAEIEDEAFVNQNSLNTLDISINPLIEIPTMIFHLPSLMNLYLSQMNMNMNIAEIVEKSKPITSPLAHVDISLSEIDTLPDFGILPSLIKYNISGNNFQPVRVRVSDLSGLCKLKIFDNQNVSAIFDTECDCWNINNWLKVRGVKFAPFKCFIDEASCPFVIQFDDVQTYKKCEELYEDKLKQSRLFKTGLSVGIVLIVVVLIILYILWRRRQKAKKEEVILKVKPDSLGLL